MTDSKMRIGIFVPWITSNRGGTEAVGSMVASAMAARGHDVFVYTFDDAFGAPTWPLHESVVLRHFAERPSRQSDESLLLLLRGDALDVLMGLHMNRQFFRYAYYANALELPLVLSEHINPAHPREIGTFSEEERIAIFAGADRIHLILEDYLETLPEWLRPRASVIPNAVPLARRRADVVGHGRKERTLLCVARLVPRKNLDTLIQAFSLASAEVPGWRLEIAGDGPMEDVLLRSIDALGLAGRVELLGRITETYPLYERAQLFVLPSHTEGFPLTSLEAMTHGLPVVGFEDCSGLNAQIEHERSGLLVPREDSVRSLANALARLMRDDALRGRLGEGAYLRSAAFHPDAIADRWEAMLVEAAGQKDARALAEPVEPRHEALARLRWLLERAPGDYTGPMYPGARGPAASSSGGSKEIRLAGQTLRVGSLKLALDLKSLRSLKAHDFVRALQAVAADGGVDATLRERYAQAIRDGSMTKRAVAAAYLRKSGGILRANLTLGTRLGLLGVSLLRIGRGSR